MLKKTVREFAGYPVDLNDYETRFKSTDSHQKPELSKYNNLIFQGFTWKYIGNIDPYDEATYPKGFSDQIGIRLESHQTETMEELSYSFITHGWSTDPFPPIVTTCGEWKDGRGRILAARVSGEKYIPAAEFINADSSTPTSDDISNGIIANLHKYSRLSCMNDYITGATRVIEAGELERDKVAIEKWLVEEARIKDRFNTDYGICTKIIRRVLERTAEEKSLLDNRDGEHWKKTFVSKMPNISLNDVVVLMANTGTSAMKYYVEHLLKNGGKPKPLILYASNTSQEKAANDVKVFKERVETFFAQSYQLVNNSIDSVDIKTPKKLPCEILGVIPNFSSPKHVKLLSEYKLISVEEYIADGLDVSELKLVS